MWSRPSGKYLMENLHTIGGIPAIVKYLLKHTDLIDGTQLTVTGKTLAQNVENAPDIDFTTQDVIKRIDDPIKATGHITILRGNLAPGTAVAKITGKEGLRFEVPTVIALQMPPLLMVPRRALRNVSTSRSFRRI
jgi:dihydroxy-acid dehydratase